MMFDTVLWAMAVGGASGGAVALVMALVGYVRWRPRHRNELLRTLPR